MARIRSIHPSLYTDEEFMALTMEAPLAAVLLPGLWTECDDDGVFDWKPLTIKARLLPAADVDIAALLSVLLQKNFIRQFDCGGKKYGAVRNFRTFQRPKKPNTRGLLPDEFRIYVGLDAPSSEPVPHQFPTSGEKSPQMEDGGGEKGEDGGCIDDDEGARAREVKGAGEIAAAFIRLRDRHWPEHAPCMTPKITLETQAAAFLAAGGTAQLAVEHLDGAMSRMAANSRSPPASLNAFKHSLNDVLVNQRSGPDFRRNGSGQQDSKAERDARRQRIIEKANRGNARRSSGNRD